MPLGGDQGTVLRALVVPLVWQQKLSWQEQRMESRCTTGLARLVRRAHYGSLQKIASTLRFFGVACRLRAGPPLHATWTRPTPLAYSLLTG